jgi:transposase
VVQTSRETPGRSYLNRPGMSGDFIRCKEDEVMGRPSQYPRELKERAIRLVVETKHEYDSEFVAISKKLGIKSPETLSRWVRQAEVDGGDRPGRTSQELAEIRDLKRENAELRRANEILKTASALFAAELDRRRDGRCVTLRSSR